MVKLFASIILLAIVSSSMCNELQVANFLQESSDEVIQINVNYVKDAIELVGGFYQGVGIFNATSAQYCFAGATDPQIIASALNIYHIIKAIDIKDIIPSLKQIFAEGTNIYARALETYQECARLPEEYVALFKKLVPYMANSEYLQKVAFHTMTHITQFGEKAEAGVEEFKNKKFFESGKSFGEIINLALFFDFKN
jgi:hypothetical protein